MANMRWRNDEISIDFPWNKPRQGEIWMCNLANGSGSVQMGARPVFVLSNDKNNTFSTTLNVIPLTSQTQKNNLPIHVSLWDYGRYGLHKPSVLLVEQITTVSMNSLSMKLGVIDDRETLARIRRALEIQLPIVKM